MRHPDDPRNDRWYWWLWLVALVVNTYVVALAVLGGQPTPGDVLAGFIVGVLLAEGAPRRDGKLYWVDDAP